MKKVKITITIDREIKKILDQIYAKLKEEDERRTYGEIVSALLLHSFNKYEEST